MLEKIREFFFGETRTSSCPCGGIMKETGKSFIPARNINPMFVCEDCGSKAWRGIFYPSEKFKEMEK